MQQERKGRILVVDDVNRWREVLRDSLIDGGFHADTAASIEETKECLKQDFYHLLILDINMEDNLNDNNTEGMELLRSLDTFAGPGAVKVIMLSAYGTKEQMREAFRKYDIEDFLTKEDFDDEELLSQVRDLFADKEKGMKINLDLDINWQKVADAKQIVHNTFFAGQRISRDTPDLAVRAATELEDLLCRLFYQNDSLLVQPLTVGRSGAGVLLTERFDASGSAPPVVVKFGEAQDIQQEYEHFVRYVQGRIGGGRTTTVFDRRYTQRYGGIIYSTLGASGERFESFESFYQRATIDQIKTVLQRLFFDACHSWYESLGVRRVHNLTEEYQRTLRFSADMLERALTDRFKGVQGKQRLQFRQLGLEHTFTNPMDLLERPPLLRSTYSCITHGDLHAQNILVDSDLHAWLIDFLRTGAGHVLRDVALLDTAIRIQLLTPDDAQLDERWKLEQALLNVRRFSELDQLDETLPTGNQALAKAYETSLFLRKLARRIVPLNDDFSEYVIASLFYALNLTRFYGLHMVQREHALLAASLMAEYPGL